MGGRVNMLGRGVVLGSGSGGGAGGRWGGGVRGRCWRRVGSCGGVDRWWRFCAV